ncbi:MAG: FkbM family methyltransferase, partial [Alphaproteobacteria bacterium]|nr:FkbM family methyltransferase [Alphaproteobacteria bacterium]
MAFRVGAAPRIKVVDIGALPIEGISNSWDSLVEQDLCDTVGFEPNEEACAKLNAEAKPSQQYLPYAIADGEPATFRQCNFPMTSSLLEPNAALLNMFSNLGELTKVVSREPIDTHRLDDIDAAAGTDFLKLDVQGAELMIIENATKV